ncbi:MAG: helix-turn-helix domain-containing protein [Clostridiales bacterium]|jgi:transcriptional regulator with XRE-family HTH domain|nr:helix-turn-helix domain-containing protein [Clostridiales bacterium]
MNFAEQLKDLRAEKGISQMQLARAIDVSQSAIAKYELNRTEPTASVIKKLMDYFGVSFEELMGYDK